MILKKVLIVLTIVTIVSCIQYQNTEYQWKVQPLPSRLYSWLSVNFVVPDQQGNIYLTGRAQVPADNLTIEKYNALGEQQWMKYYDNPFGDGGFDAGHSIEIDTMGNIYVAGQAQGMSSQEEEILLKFDPSGNILWEYRPVPSVIASNGYPHRLKIVDSGEVYLIVESTNQTAVVLNPEGMVQRSFEIHNTVRGELQRFHSEIDNSGNIVLSNRLIAPDVVPPYPESLIGQQVKKIDAMGNIAWEITNLDVHHIETLALDYAGDIIVVSIVYDAGKFTKRLEKIATNDGTIQWREDFTGAVNWNPSSLIIDTQNNIYIDDINFNSLTVVAKFSPAGAILWKGESIFTDPATSYVDLQLDSVDRLYLTRTSFGVANPFMARTFVFNPDGSHLLTINSLNAEMEWSGVDHQDNFYRLTSAYNQWNAPPILTQYKVNNLVN